MPQTNDRAKEAALAQINTQKEDLLSFARAYRYEHPFNDFEEKMSIINSKIKEYAIDISICQSIVIQVHEELMENRKYEIAEKFAKKYIDFDTGQFTKPELKKASPPPYIDFSLPVFLTFTFGFILFIILLFKIEIEWYFALIISLLYMYLHPYIGKGLYLIAIEPSKGIDQAFDLSGDDSWNNWLKKYSLVFSATWPIIAIPFILIATLASIFGNIYKNLFK